LSAIFAVFITFAFASNAFPQDEEAIKFFNQGQDAHEKGDFLAAIRSYDEALKIIPEFPEAEYQKGNALLSLDKADDAEKAFRRAIVLREDWSLPITSLGALLVEKNNFAEAETLLTKAVELDDSNFLAYSALTDLRLKTKSSPDVLKDLLEKLKILTAKAKPPASVWASRAALENALGDKAAAKTSLNRALTIDPNNKNALIERAEIALFEGDTTAAMRDAQTLAKLAPNSLPVKLLTARVFYADGRKDEAQKILASIENPTVEVISMRNKLSANESENAAELEKELEKNPKDAAILGRLCSLERISAPVKALEYCRRANEVEPNNISHAVGYGGALVQAKQYESAVLILRRIIKIAPENSTAHAHLAIALFQLKRLEEAITEYRWITEKHPNSAIAYYFLAISYDTLGQYLDAMANYQQFLKLADKTQNQLEIEKVGLRLPSLQKLIKSKK
jgi:tetratricopeptide (TPR) repeat protein